MKIMRDHVHFFQRKLLFFFCCESQYAFYKKNVMYKFFETIFFFLFKDFQILLLVMIKNFKYRA